MEIDGTSSIAKQTKEESHEVSLDIDEVAKSVRQDLKIKYAFSSACCIYRVPERLRSLNKEAYAPRVVSLGPIHHGKENLKAMEDHKKMYLQQFLDQNKVSVEDLINIIKENETELRDCYAETIQLNRKDFATMIAMDAVFIIMVLLNLEYRKEYCKSERRDRIFFRPWKLIDVLSDICLLENQLPFFILEKLFELSGEDANPRKFTLKELTYSFLKFQWVEWVKEESLEKINSSRVLHFVNFLRNCQRPSEAKQKTSSASTATESHQVGLDSDQDPIKTHKTLTVPSVVELHRAGIKFGIESSKNLFDISFDRAKGTLKIPPLQICDSTEILFRNLQAFEQCHYAGRYIIGNYITMINLIVHTTKDVERLTKEGIIENWLRDDDAVLSIFHNLSNGNLVAKDFYFSGVVKDLNDYYGKRRHKWKAYLKQNYFRNPWTIISVVAAAVLLILTVIQTVCSIRQTVCSIIQVK